MKNKFCVFSIEFIYASVSCKKTIKVKENTVFVKYTWIFSFKV